MQQIYSKMHCWYLNYFPKKEKYVSWLNYTEWLYLEWTQEGPMFKCFKIMLDYILAVCVCVYEL